MRELKTCEKCLIQFTNERDAQCPVCLEQAKTFKKDKVHGRNITKLVSDCCFKGVKDIKYPGYPMKRVCKYCHKDCLGTTIIIHNEDSLKKRGNMVK